MSPGMAISNLQLVLGSTMEPEIKTIKHALSVIREEARKSVKARGILEALVRDIHAKDASHKSAIECAWVAVAKVDAS